MNSPLEVCSSSLGCHPTRGRAYSGFVLQGDRYHVKIRKSSTRGCHARGGLVPETLDRSHRQERGATRWTCADVAVVRGIAYKYFDLLPCVLFPFINYHTEDRHRHNKRELLHRNNTTLENLR
jgi:hypothetical protein